MLSPAAAAAAAPLRRPILRVCRCAAVFCCCCCCCCCCWWWHSRPHLLLRVVKRLERLQADWPLLFWMVRVRPFNRKTAHAPRPTTNLW